MQMQASLDGQEGVEESGGEWLVMTNMANVMSLKEQRLTEYQMTSYPILKDLMPDSVATFLDDFNIYELQLKGMGVDEAMIVRNLDRDVLKQSINQGVDVTNRAAIMEVFERLRGADAVSRKLNIIDKIRSSLVWKNLDNPPASMRYLINEVEIRLSGLELGEYEDKELCKTIVTNLPKIYRKKTVDMTVEVKDWKHFAKKTDLMKSADTFGNFDFDQDVLTPEKDKDKEGEDANKSKSGQAGAT